MAKLDEIRKIIGVSPEEVSARVKKSKATFRNVDAGTAAEGTRNLFLDALEQFRREKIEVLRNLNIKSVS